MLPSGRWTGPYSHYLGCSLCASVTACPSLDTNGPDNQTFYNHLLPPCSPLRYARVSRWAGRYVINPLNLGLIDIFDLLKCEEGKLRVRGKEGELSLSPS